MHHPHSVSVAFILALGTLVMSESADAQTKTPTRAQDGDAFRAAGENLKAGQNDTNKGDEQTAGENLDEAILSAKIRMALLKGLKGADGMRIEVTVKDSSVALAGEVNDRASMKLASEVAKSVEGVKQVKSTITLNPKSPKQDSFGAEINDATLVTEVRLVLMQELGADAFKIHVAAASGVVSLRGTLSTPLARDRAVSVVNALSAVKRVEDLIEVTKK